MRAKYKKKSKQKIILITADETRHRFFKNKINELDDFHLSLCVYEDFKKGNLQLKKKNKSFPLKLKKHFEERSFYEKKYQLNFLKNKKIKEVKISLGRIKL